MIFEFSLRRALSIAKKEKFHILRDPFTLTMATILPVLLVLIFGLAIEFNVKDIGLTVHDSDRTFASRKLVEVFSSSQYFKITQNQSSTENAINNLDSEKSKAILIIEPDFEHSLLSDGSAKVQFFLDGADNSTAGVILGYLGGIQQAAALKLTGQEGQPFIQLKTRYLFNPELSSPWFVVPGLAVVVIAILSILLTALTVAREWENGSMELLLSTPVQPLEIIIGKLIPYTIIGLAAVLLVVSVAIFGFKIPFAGNIFLFGFGSLVFLIACLAQGMLISVLIRTQQLSMQVAMITGLLPSLLLSGFIFPLESMPMVFQNFTSILPSKWFMIISRGIFLKGADLVDLKIPFFGLFILSSILIVTATKKFKKDLEP
ncbi:MAG: ABC transporter permease [Pseudobdellovibrio sp.]